MRGAVRRMSLIADERNRSIRLIVREGEVEVTAQSSEEGEGREVVPADYKGDEIQLGFNWQYLFEFLTNAATGDLEAIASSGQSAEAESSDKGKGTAAAAAPAREGRAPLRVRFEFKDANAQTQMSIADETTYDYKYIVMPLRI